MTPLESLLNLSQTAFAWTQVYLNILDFILDWSLFKLSILLSMDREIPVTPRRSPGRALLAKTPERSSLLAKHAILFEAIPIADDASVREALERTDRAADETIAVLREYKVEARRRHLAEKAAINDELARLEAERETQARLAAEEARVREAERADEQHAQQAVSTLEARKRDMSASLAALRADVEEWDSRRAATQQVLDTRRQCLSEHVQANTAELKTCAQTLGLDIVSLAPDRLSFNFSLVDPTEYKRVFTLVLDLTPQFKRVLSFYYLYCVFFYSPLLLNYIHSGITFPHPHNDDRSCSYSQFRRKHLPVSP